MKKETATERLAKAFPDKVIMYKPLKGFFMLESDNGETKIWHRIGTSERNANYYLKTLKEGN